MIRCLALLPLLVTPALQARQQPGLYYACQADASRIELEHAESADARDPSRGPAEWIDPSALVEYSAEDARGEVWRTGSTSITRQCGDLRLTVSGGYFNHRIQGEMGAAADFAIVEVTDGDGRSSGRLAIGTCNPSFPRYSSMVECPRDWVTGLNASRMLRAGEAGMLLDLVHHYQEFREPVPAGESDPARQR